MYQNIPVLGVPAGESVKDVEALTGVQVVDGTLVVDQESMLGQLGVDGAPPDVLGSGLLINNALVAGGATGLLSRGGDEGTGRGDGSAGLVAESILVELGDGGVAEEVDAGVVDTVLSDGGVQSGIVLVDGAGRRSGAVGGSHFCVCLY